MLGRLLARIRSGWRGLRRSSDIDADMREEFEHHIAMRTEHLMQSGMDARQAERQARVEFGHQQTHREDARASRGLGWLDELRFSSVDVKLGLRMLMKYPGLSIISVAGMAVAIAIGAGAFGFLTTLITPSVPLPEGDRIVSIQSNDVEQPGTPERRILHDFHTWREELQHVVDLGAFRAGRRNFNVVGPGGQIRLVRVADITASGFRTARVDPVLGRALLDEDESPAAPPVIVIGYEPWQTMFNGASDVIGREVRLGNVVHTVVGVMPEGFAFPVNHRFWVPLRIDPSDYPHGGGPAINVFGRLAPDASFKEARAEIALAGSRAARAYPETHGHRRPTVVPYTYPFFEVDSPAEARIIRAAQFGIGLLLVVVAINVAVLVYARTATRAGEISIRSALGASRRRIVAQLVVEALVMSLVAAGLGLALAATALGKIEAFQEVENADGLAFWVDVSLNWQMVAYAMGLAVTAAVIVGVLPALKATGRRVQQGLQQISQGGSALQLGGTWTVMIVLQVGIAVAALPYALAVAGLSLQRGTDTTDYPASEVLRASVAKERIETPPPADSAEYERSFRASFRQGMRDLVDRLEGDPLVKNAALSSSFPGTGAGRMVEVEGAPGEGSTGTARVYARTNGIDTQVFEVFDVRPVAGRLFDTQDVENGNAVIVDEVLANQVASPGEVLGRRLRFVTPVRVGDAFELQRGPWQDVVGVVPDFTLKADFDPPNPKVYTPMVLDSAPTILTLTVRVNDGAAGAHTGFIREATAGVDPTLQLHELTSDATSQRQLKRALLSIALVTLAVTGSVLLLSAAGIYAMMSFTVTRRIREIGIRSALGAGPGRILRSIFARAGAQVGAGMLVGLLVAFGMDRAAGGIMLGGRGMWLFPVVGLFMIAIGLMATFGPARRGLAVQPMDALRHD